MEVHAWRALRESGEAVFEYIDDECTMAIDGRILDAETKPPLKKYLKKEFRPWATYEMHDVRVLEIGMMAASVIYKVTATRIESMDKPPQQYSLICSSSWKQGADAEWKMVTHTEASV